MEYLTVVGVYAAEKGRKGRRNQKFYDSLQRKINKIKTEERVPICNDLTTRIIYQSILGVLRAFGEQIIKNNGRELRQFSPLDELKIRNSFL